MAKKVEMEKAEYEREHRKLVRILTTGSPSERRKEAESQKREVAEHKRKK